MNKNERVRAALKGQPVDKVPGGFWFHFPSAQAHGQASIDAHLETYRATDVDFVKIMNEHPYRANVEIREPADWRNLRPAPLSADFYQEQLDEIKGIVDGLNGECLTVSTIFNPFSEGNHAADHLVTEHLKADPESVNQGLAAIAESLAEFAVACVEAGASGIYYSAQGGEEDRFSAQEFLNYIKPHDLTILNALKSVGEFHLLHICKDRIRLPLYADYPCHAVNWAATKHNLSLIEGRDLFQRTIVGGLGDRGIIVDGNQEEIQAAVQQVIAEFGPTGLMLGADCTLPTDISLANIRAAMAATMLSAV